MRVESDGKWEFDLLADARYDRYKDQYWWKIHVSASMLLMSYLDLMCMFTISSYVYHYASDPPD